MRVVSHKDIGPAIAVVIAKGRAHPGLSQSLQVIGRARNQTLLGESAVTAVAIEKIRRAVVGDIEVNSAIVVVVRHRHPSPLPPASYTPASRVTSAKPAPSLR